MAGRLGVWGSWVAAMMNKPVGRAIVAIRTSLCVAQRLPKVLLQVLPQGCHSSNGRT